MPLASPDRTIPLPSSWLIAQSQPQQPSPQWPVHQPGDSLYYGINLSAATTDDGVYITAMQISNAPSGSGEIQASGLTLGDGNIAEVKLTGGQPGRAYIFALVLTLSSGEDLEIPISLSVSSALATGVTPPAPSPGFSTPIEWALVPSFDFSSVANSGYLPLIAGV